MTDKRYRYWEDREEIANQLRRDAIDASEIKTFDFYTQWGIAFSNGEKGDKRNRTATRFFDDKKHEPPEFVYQSEIDRYRDSLKKQGFLK